MECKHEHFHTEHREKGMTRFIPRGWERENEDDCFEYVTLTDSYVICDDCGEVIDVEYGD